MSVPMGWFVAEDDGHATLLALDREPQPAFVIQRASERHVDALWRFARMLNRLELLFDTKLTEVSREVRQGGAES